MRRSGWLAALIGIACLTGCGESRSDIGAPSTSSAELSLPAVIVDAQWLHRNLNSENLVVIDARDPKEYEAGHIPGAVNLPPDDLLDPNPSNSKNLAPLALVQRTLGKAGVDMDQSVVIYDGSKYREAARVFWVLEVHGHPSVAVLNGGYGGWIDQQLTTSVAPVRPPHRRFVAAMNPERMATKLTVLRAMENPNTVILDARTDDEYRGLISKARRKGHIRSAINVDFENNLVFSEKGVCSLKLSEELMQLYRSQLKGSAKILSYCNSGNRASVSYLALRSIGYDVAVYDGSWLEWGNDPELPIEPGS